MLLPKLKKEPTLQPPLSYKEIPATLHATAAQKVCLGGCYRRWKLGCAANCHFNCDGYRLASFASNVRIFVS